MGVAGRFYEAFTVRDHYTMGLLYAEHATFSDLFFSFECEGTRLMWQCCFRCRALKMTSAST